MNKRQIGTAWEKAACAYLSECGYIIAECNYRCRLGEIDIIARDNTDLIFVEVKFRSSNKYGYSLEAVDLHKQQKIRKIAQYYCITHGISENISIRFDVIGFDSGKITHIKNAF